MLFVEAVNHHFKIRFMISNSHLLTTKFIPQLLQQILHTIALTISLTVHIYHIRHQSLGKTRSNHLLTMVGIPMQDAAFKSQWGTIPTEADFQTWRSYEFRDPVSTAYRLTVHNVYEIDMTDLKDFVVLFRNGIRMRSDGVYELVRFLNSRRSQWDYSHI